MRYLIPFSIMMIALVACGPAPVGNTPQSNASTQAREVVVVTALPTPTNFPQVGTPTPIPPTRTPAPTATPLPAQSAFDDETLSEMMEGTIGSAGVSASVEIVDRRSSGGERVANITIISEYNIDESELLLKLFVLEVGSALRALRAFSEGTIDADLNAAFIVVNNRAGEELGTVYAPIPDVRRFLDGEISVNEALNLLELTGVFESFVE